MVTKNTIAIVQAWCYCMCIGNANHGDTKTMRDTSHLVALHESLSRERSRLESSTTQKERDFRTHCISVKQREIDAEYEFLGMTPGSELAKISDDDLLAELA